MSAGDRAKTAALELIRRLNIDGAVVVLLNDKGSDLNVELAGFSTEDGELGALTERIGAAVRAAVQEHGDLREARVMHGPLLVRREEGPS